jgi:ABC-type multidrug transport system fused ATPase/permease subunit
MAYYTPKWLAVVGIAASVAAAGQLPIFGFLLSKMVFTLMIPLSDPSFETERDFWVAMFGLLCCGIFLFTYVQKLAFGYGSENLTYKVRALLFEAILYKHIGWFDSKDRAPGVLGNIIQEDIAQLNGLTSETYGVALEAILGLVLSSALCLWFSWQVGLITIILSPMMVFGGFFMSSF